MTVAIVNLDREFIEIGDDKTLGDRSLPFRSRLAGRGTGWAQVLAHPRVVLLGEAGTGKTTEFEEQRKRCRLGGTPAFFARIENLAVHGLELALEPVSDWDEVQTWNLGEKRAVFLLDSVDEARLKGQEFRLALRRLAKDLGEARNRVTVLISCRVSDWQAHADRKTVEDCLPWVQATAADGDSAKQPAVRVFSFAPLNDPQVRHLCGEGHGLSTEDTRKFLDAVLAAQAEDFLDRPRDVEWMIGHWRDKGGIGRLTEIIETNIRRKLSEPRHRERPRHADVSDDRLMMGARSLAAAVTVMRKPALRLPDHGSIQGVAADAFDPAAILPDWTEAERQELLSRALFDEATYGRVRFHHRSVTEYLAARWVSDRLDRGCSPPEIDGILFPTIYGRRVVAPSLAAVAGWLAGWNDHIRSSVLSVAPAILIEHGDPRALPLDIRADILRRAVHRLYDAPHGEEGVSYEALERFAAPELAPVVRELHDRFVGDARVLALLLRLIHHGRMRDCADLALAVVLTGESRELRSYGLFALEEAGGPAERIALAECLLADKVAWDAEARGWALSLCIQGAMTPAQFLDVTGKLDFPDPRSSKILPDIFEKISAFLIPDEWLPEVLDGFLDLCRRKPFGAMRDSLRTALSRLLERILDNDEHVDSIKNNIVEAICFLGNSGDGFRYIDNELEIIENVISKRPIIKKELFNRWVESERRFGGSREFMRLQRLESWRWRDSLDENDLTWLLDDLRPGPKPDDRSSVLECVVMLWKQFGRSADLRARIEEAAGDSEGLMAELLLLTQEPRLSAGSYLGFMNPIKNFDNSATKFEKQKAEIEEDFNNNKGILTEKSLITILDMTKNRGISINNIGNFFENRIVNSAHNGFISYWRDQARSGGEGIEDLMLAGIALDIGDGQSSAPFSEAEVKAAAGLAFRRMMFFPSWGKRLIETYPDIVRTVFLSHIHDEWRVEGNHQSMAIIRLDYSPSAIKELVAPGIFEFLRLQIPVRLDFLKAALRIVLSSDVVPKKSLVNLAMERIGKVSSDDAGFVIWLTFLLRFDGKKAVNIMEEKLKTLSKEAASHLVSELCNNLPALGYENFNDIAGLPRDIPSLRELIAIIFMHTRKSEICIHDHKEFDSSARERTERVRDSALHRLADIPGKEAHDALLDLADQLTTVADPFWFRRLAARRAAADGDPVPWTPEAVVAFERDHEGTPASSADLHRIVMGRLEWIRQDLETGEFSVRTLFDDRTEETDVQLWLAGALWVRANRRYTVHREEQVNRAKRTDIRLHNVKCKGPVCIEIKVADKWTVPALEVALEDQLVGQYLHAHEARHGILLLFRTGKKREWRPNGRAPMTFGQLVEHLRGRAADLVRRHPGVERLDVVGMDAGDPS
ncbi:hypothetical protein AZL_a00100 (plasmid) [Azospirillum sp. B510]|uniref:hypothetical protein n=1 Tax=Azospirillum sp. (strain B510) TaxID=137722 RepID=UPI0001C4BCA3|nr:hypothetical protein [Azospirillum sp. B510]BAI73541.1 hypothetical protein AZL_a00100 [Azospirillum sp. B510]